MSVTESPDSTKGTVEIDAPVNSLKLLVIIGVLLAVVGAIGGFHATWSGMVLRVESDASSPGKAGYDRSLPDMVFVPVDPLVVSLGNRAGARHLRFRAQLEVPSRHQEEVTQLLPRVVDVLNSYLRALEPSDLEDQSGLARLRAQMLRRVQVVVGQGRVADILVMEFVLN
ncbi:flagellar basal body-associated FliL family protein [Sulfitobacter aestuariivivens]|uniref:Flagellar protein FliL n=1 Tax=Sulfitobacter aestuariivivens TaxID=2766981 RepID=A0A927D5E7_9RHOB|nr:flagellar basal body-associated FliL family protein [Sulfitobacter aestuariivivens]MBD3665520.1 flagellar basal body-associated FliL family protein [Sulfitobacter aestuariivivens]